MTDPYERDKIPAPPHRPVVDFWRPARWLVWQWLRAIGPGSEEEMYGLGRVLALAQPFAIAIALGTYFLLLTMNPEAEFFGSLLLASAGAGQLVPAIVRWWVRNAMRLDEKESADYWKDRFRL